MQTYNYHIFVAETIRIIEQCYAKTDTQYPLVVYQGEPITSDINIIVKYSIYDAYNIITLLTDNVPHHLYTTYGRTDQWIIIPKPFMRDVADKLLCEITANHPIHTASVYGGIDYQMTDEPLDQIKENIIHNINLLTKVVS